MKFKYLIRTLLATVLVVSCHTNPYTGKKTLALVGNAQIFPMAFQQYNQFLTENNVVRGTSDAAMIERVGRKIAKAAERWANAIGHPEYLKDYKWEYNLVNDKTVNAWCMPGGKIVFYTGILPIAAGERGVAAIMGHEVAHALLNHGQQRMSAGQIQQVAGVVGAATLGQKNPQLFAAAFGYGSQVGVMLPFSRNHETEADKMGIELMAIAGYNPDEASKLWERMKSNSGGQAPSEILSTHPSNDTRIANLRAWAPAAKAKARQFGVTNFQ